MSEAQEQKWLFEWAMLARQEHEELELLYHVPNGGKRNSKEAASLKKQGVRSGVPDICLPVARSKYHGLYIELKFGRNKTSKNQNTWIEGLRKQNYCAVVCYGWLEAREIIEKYLNEEVIQI